MNGTLGVVGTGDFKATTECDNLSDLYTAKRTDWWKWPNAADFDVAYQVRDSLITLELPHLEPELESVDNIYTLCGDILHELRSPD